jgi:hypothetical protein
MTTEACRLAACLSIMFYGVFTASLQCAHKTDECAHPVCHLNRATNYFQSNQIFQK